MMTFSEIMNSLSKMYNTYDATCWLSKTRRSFKGENAATLLRRGDSELVSKVLIKEPRYKDLHARKSRRPSA